MMFERMGINASFFHGPLDLSFFTERRWISCVWIWA